MPRSSMSASRSKANATAYVALLRGINVGGKNMLPMSKLAPMFSDAGCVNVQTYIQSGNVVFSATPACAAEIPALISKRIAKGLGFQPVIILRTAAEMRRIVEDNPFIKTRDQAGLENLLHIAFLNDAPTKASIAALDPNRSAGDSFLVRGREIYLNLPKGVGKTKLTNGYFDSALGVTSTMRNWRTALKLLEMAQQAR
ncbi:MAG: DUF1697 domain-containing protein [Phycisphaerales bacterium]|nr:DUF1697 domain-containing protein [Phycisphaerales bacterium]MCI0674779.1 DUF1697 domain-containing protein [Phycisphaerales bacterium]